MSGPRGGASDVSGPRLSGHCLGASKPVISRSGRIWPISTNGKPTREFRNRPLLPATQSGHDHTRPRSKPTESVESSTDGSYTAGAFPNLSDRRMATRAIERPARRPSPPAHDWAAAVQLPIGVAVVGHCDQPTWLRYSQTRQVMAEAERWTSMLDTPFRLSDRRRGHRWPHRHRAQSAQCRYQRLFRLRLRMSQLISSALVRSAASHSQVGPA